MNDSHLYKEFSVELQFRDRVYGGIPKTEKMIDAYISSKFGVENADLAGELKKEVGLVEETEKVTTGFRRDENGPFLGDYQLKALLKQSASRLRLTTKKRGVKNDITDGLFMEPKLYLLGDVPDPLPTEDFCGHVQTPQGKRSIVKQSEFVERGKLAFTIRLIKGAKLSNPGPVELDILFYLPRPKGHFGTGRNAGTLKQSSPPYHTTKPDLTKLVRAAEDALKGVIWNDDNQVVIQCMGKLYADEGAPGAEITVKFLS